MTKQTDYLIPLAHARNGGSNEYYTTCAAERCKHSYMQISVAEHLLNVQCYKSCVFTLCTKKSDVCDALQERSCTLFSKTVQILEAGGKTKYRTILYCIVSIVRYYIVSSQYRIEIPLAGIRPPVYCVALECCW